MYSLSDYDYDLPEALIAQYPEAQRESSRLLHLNRPTGEIYHRKFSDLPNCLNSSDVLVVNNTEVIPGRLLGHKKSGGKAEVLVLDYQPDRKTYESEETVPLRCLIKSSKRPKIGTAIDFDAGLVGIVTGTENGFYTVDFSGPEDFQTLLYKVGKVPLPPYVRREASESDINAYQTVYASRKGAIAAPTAGLHFTKHLLEKIKNTGVRIVPITLHVGYGTFMPVRVPDIRNHQMHTETFEISKKTADVIMAAKRNENRIVAVGTTCVRTLEYVFSQSEAPTSLRGQCDLFIYPGYRFKTVDAMITNFHLPKSTLIMLVAAFAGRKTLLKTYRQAVEKRYRFFSYGDAMLIE